MECPFVIKVCNKCNKILVANSFNFRKKKGGKYGVGAVCKICYNEDGKRYNEINKDIINEKNRKRYHENIETERERGRQKYERDKEKINKQYRDKYKNNSEYRTKQLKNSHEHYIKKQEYYKEQHKKYYYEHIEYYEEYRKQWREDNPDKVFNNAHKRRLKKEQQGDGITIDQWLECMEFFDWKCAYSDEYIGGRTNKRTLDHIVPLNNNGEHEIWNLVPMVRSYNSSKNDKNMEEWYQQQEYYSEERLNKIYKWQEYAKNKWNNKE